jgi:hypothetical protein
MNLTTALVAVAVLGYVFARRLSGEPLHARRLVLLPVALTGWGGYTLAHTHMQARTLDLAVLAVGAAVGLIGGMLRGATVRVFPRDGHLWYRYRPLTIAIWVVLIALRVGQTVAGHAVGADTAVLSAGLPLMFGLSLLGEAAVVGGRGLRTGVPFAPRRPERPAAPRSGADRW